MVFHDNDHFPKKTNRNVAKMGCFESSACLIECSNNTRHKCTVEEIIHDANLEKIALTDKLLDFYVLIIKHLRIVSILPMLMYA